MNDRFSEQQKEVLQLLKLLDDNNVLPYVVLAGSWAEYVYAQAGVLPGFSLTLRTIDIDFLVKNLRKPSEQISLPAIVKSKGYSIAHDILLGTTKIFSPGGLEIEFLIAQKGSGKDPVLKTNLGVNAQALRHMEGVMNNLITADLFGMKVQIPCPEIYVLHKMLINDVRKASKQTKDRNSITQLLPYINLDKTKELYEQMSKKEKTRVRAFIERHGSEISDELPLDAKIKFATFIKTAFSISDQKEPEKTKENAPQL